jgi:hypothetical protein
LPRCAQEGAAVNDNDLNNPNVPKPPGTEIEKPFRPPPGDDRGLRLMENLVNLPALIPVPGCSIDKGEVVFHDTGYRIDVRECDTPVKIVGWAFHMAEKTWMTPRLFRAFIRVACTAAGLPPPWRLTPPCDSRAGLAGGSGPAAELEDSGRWGRPPRRVQRRVRGAPPSVHGRSWRE